MFQLTNLTAAGNQTTVAVLADGTAVTLKFLYRAGVQRWTVDVTWGAFKRRCLGLTTNANRLRTYRNIIPFGLKVSTADGTDPFLANDLDCSAGPPRVQVFILDGAGDIADAEAGP